MINSAFLKLKERNHRISRKFSNLQLENFIFLGYCNLNILEIWIENTRKIQENIIFI